MIKENIKIIKDFFKLVKGSKFWITLLFIGSILGHLSSLLIPVFVSNIVYEVTNANADATYLNILYLFIVYVFYNACWFLNYVAYTYNFRFCYRNLKEKIINKIFKYDLEFTQKISKGTILNTVSKDAADLSEMIDNICEIIVVCVKLVVIMIIFLKTNILIGLFVLLLEYLYLKSYDKCNIGSAKHLDGQRKYADKLTDNLSQILNGLNEISLFNIFSKVKKRFDVIAEKWQDEYMKKSTCLNIKESVLPAIIHLGKVILYLILSYLVLKGKYEVNILVLLVSYFEEIMTNTTQLMTYSGQIRDWHVSINRINCILNYSNKNEIEFGINDNEYINGLVEFKKVSFAYHKNSNIKIRKLSFIAKPNEITTIVGKPGNGKTTILNLLLRKYKMDEGNIYIDNVDIYDYSKAAYSKNITSVNENPFIFSMSIKNNLNLIDRNVENQIEACKRVGIHDYIMSLPKQYNTVIQENASNFSLEQRQLLSLARAVLSKVEILLFDEITNSLSSMSSENIKDIFEDLKQDHTIILITHNKEMMKFSDNIIVMNDGKIVATGKHEELIKYNKYYIDIQNNNYSSYHKE